MAVPKPSSNEKISPNVVKSSQVEQELQSKPIIFETTGKNRFHFDKRALVGYELHTNIDFRQPLNNRIVIKYSFNNSTWEKEYYKDLKSCLADLGKLINFKILMEELK